MTQEEQNKIGPRELLYRFVEEAEVVLLGGIVIMIAGLQYESGLMSDWRFLGVAALVAILLYFRVTRDGT